jgi:site-specific DNA-methyltransferase (adenine-specific)
MTPADVIEGRARWCVVEGDAAEVLRGIGDGVAAAVVTDPPSGIAFMGAEWDRDKGGRAQWVAWLAGILADARRCTRDGGRSVVWSLPRTSHWTGCAVEDAGWSVENTITHLFGTGWPKGKSQLKPAAETWWLARTGRSEPLNVDACRVRTDEKRAAVFSGAKGAQQAEFGAGTVLGNSGKYLSEPHDGGRYPPNVVLSHSPGCVCVGTRKVRSESGSPVIVRGASTGVGAGYGSTAKGNVAHGHNDADGTETVEAWECVEGCPVAELDAQSGETYSGDPSKPNRRLAGMGAAFRDDSWEHDPTSVGVRYGDTGGASRFFPCFPADPAVFRYVAKPSSAEKSEGVDLEPRPADAYAAHRGRRMEEPSRFDGAEVSSASNDHPTVKSIALMRWLVDLVTQRDDLVIDPFGGSGTTGAACLASGRRVILIERDPRFAEIARQRCAHWGAEWSAPARASRRRTKRATDDGPQGGLFDARGPR